MLRGYQFVHTDKEIHHRRARPTVLRSSSPLPSAATVGSSGPARAFFFLPTFQVLAAALVRVQIRIGPSDNTRWKRDRGTDNGAESAKPSGGTRAKRDDEKSSSGFVRQERKVAG